MFWFSVKLLLSKHLTSNLANKTKPSLTLVNPNEYNLYYFINEKIK